MSSGASGGVSVKAGPSPKLGGRSALRRAQRRALVRQSRVREDLDVVAVACAYVCAECGQLGRPQQRAGASPHRSDTEGAPRLDPCDNCDSDAWIDLSRDSTVLALRNGEQESLVFRAANIAQIPALLGLVAGIFAGLFLFSASPLVELITTAMGFGGACAGLGIGALLRRRGVETSTALPHRWTMALPPPPSERPVTHFEGPIEGTGEVLRSPITGRPCLAYEIGLRGDERQDASLGTWMLIEQHVAPAKVNDVDLDPSATHLSLPRHRVGKLAKGELDDAALAYFRQRGYTLEGTTLIVYESIVEEGARVVVESRTSGSVLRPASPALIAAQPIRSRQPPQTKLEHREL